MPCSWATWMTVCPGRNGSARPSMVTVGRLIGIHPRRRPGLPPGGNGGGTTRWWGWPRLGVSHDGDGFARSGPESRLELGPELLQDRAQRPHGRVRECADRAALDVHEEAREEVEVGRGAV